MTPQEAAELKAQGWTDEEIAGAIPVPQQEEAPSYGQTIGRTVKAHAGGYIGGGAGFIGGASPALPWNAAAIAAAPETFGVSLAVPLLSGIAGSIGGGYLGQKAQEAITPDEIYKAQQLAAQQAAEANPNTALATDIIASSLASGGRPSKDIFRAGKGLIGKLGGAALEDTEKAALSRVVMGAAVNPAINTGMSLATTGELPSGKDLAYQALGGSIFTKQFGGIHGEPKAEVNNGEVIVKPKTETPSIETPFTAKDEDGGYRIGNKSIKNLYLKQFITKLEGDEITKAQIRTANDKLRSMDVNKMRQALHEQMANESLRPTTEVKPTVEEPIKQPITDAGETPEDLQKQLEESGDVSAPPDSQSDFSRYQEIQKRVSAMQKDGTAFKASGDLSDEYMKLWKESEDIKNKNGGKVPTEDVSNTKGWDKVEPSSEGFKPAVPLTEHITKHIQIGQATTGSILNKLSLDTEHPYSSLAKELAAISDKKSLETPWNHDPKLDLDNKSRSHYSIKNNQVNIGTASSADARIVMEEAIHSLTSSKIPLFKGVGEEHYNRLNTYLKTGDNEAVKSLINSYFDVAKHLGIHEQLFEDNNEHIIGDNPNSFSEKGLAGNPDEAVGNLSASLTHNSRYAMGNLHEFIAQAFKDPEFQKLLDSIPTSDKRTVWQKIVSAVRDILGLSPKHDSMLDSVLRSSSELIAQEKPKTLKDLLPFHQEFKVETSPSNSPIPESVEKESLVDLSKKGFLRPMEAAFDKVARVSTVLSEAFKRWEALKSRYIGLKDTAINDLQKYKISDVNRVMALHREAYRREGEIQGLTPKQQEISNILSRYYNQEIGQIRKESGLLINGRDPGLNKYYVPDILNQRTLDIFVNKSQSPEAEHLVNKWVENTVKESEGKINVEDARKNITAYIRALGGEHSNYLSAEFGAIRKAQGYGLPEGLREDNAILTLNRYGQRAATDLAMYKELESKPEIANALLLRDPNTGSFHHGIDENNLLPQSTEVRDAMKFVTNGFTGTMSSSTPKIAASVRFINAGILQTATGIRNTIQAPVNMIPYINKLSDFNAITKGIFNYRESARQSLEYGARQPNLDKLQFDDILSSPDKVTALAQKGATLMRKYSGAEAIESFNRDITFSIGRELAQSNIIGAKSGHKASIAWLKRFGLLVDKDITKLSGTELQDAINQTAKNFVDVNQGTYGGRGLPAGIIDSQFAPFLALQKWSVEKSNVIYKDVWKPFMTGENRLPLLTYTLGSILTGAAVQEINKLLTNRKGQDPTWKEALDKGDPLAISSELATLLQLSSFGGIVGDSMKFVSDTVLHGKMPRNIVSFPTATAIINLEEKTTDMLEAIRNGENPWEVMKAYSLDVITHQVQLARMAANYSINAKQGETSDKYRDVRVFNELEHGKATDFTKTNPFLGLDSKDFKHSKDLNESLTLLSGLIKKAIEDSKGDPYELKKNLQSLKANSYNTMPSLERTPLSFVRYLTFLKNTQGNEVARDRMMDYIKQNEINKVKSSAIP